MAKVTYSPKGEQVSLEINDMIAVDGMHLLVVHSNEEHHRGVPLGYVNLETGMMMAHFQHISHLINHVKKHYGEFKIIKSDRITIQID
jgi:hypothetical protein